MEGFPGRSTLQRAALFLATLALALAAFEAAFRVADVDFNPSPTWRYHPRLGWTQERSKSFFWEVFGRQVEVQFNSLGFRDVEREFGDPAGTRRLVVVGDSFSEAIQVGIEQTYWRQLEHRLNESGAGRWEVINLGVGDYSTAQALLTLREVGWRYAPDLVVAQIFPLNDVCTNHVRLAGLCKSRNDRYRPYLRRAPGGLEKVWAQPLRRRLRNSVVSFGALEKFYLTMIEPSEPSVHEDQHRARFMARGFEADPLLLTFAEEEAQPERIREAWRITELLLEQMARECQRRGVEWIPVVVPFQARMGAGFEDLQDAHSNIPLRPDYPEQRLGKLFQRLGADPVFARDVILSHPRRPFYLPDGHLSPQGHALLADALFEKVMQTAAAARQQSD